MWTCPKCAREFARKGQDHYCIKPRDIDEYIAFQREEVQPMLREVRETLRGAIPEAAEKLSWSMPTYWKGKNLIEPFPKKRTQKVKKKWNDSRGIRY